MLKSTLALKKSDDLFEKSSMSFGEHLDELRQALIKASMWLIAGLFVGVPSATTVVSYFQKPLEKALDEFYREKSIREMEADTSEKVTPELKNWMEANHRKAELLYIDLDEFRNLLGADSEKQLRSLQDELNDEAATRDQAPTGSSSDASGNAAQKNGSAAGEGETKDPIADKPAPGKEGAVAQTEKQAADNATAEPTPSALQAIPSPEKLYPIRAFTKIESQAETFKMQEGMMIWFKAALVVAFLVASPGIFYHIWGFVSAGLYPHERRYVYFFLPSAIGLFWLGALFAFFVVFQMVISFLLKFNAMMGVGTTPRLEDYMSFALMLPLGFGVSFQLPLVMLIVERLGIVTVKQYLGQWRMAIFVIFFSSMILTPGGDVTSMIAMGLPLIFLYFLGIALCKYLPRPSMLSGAATDPR